MSTRDRAEDLLKQLSSLSPEKRALLALRLKKKGGEFNSFPLSFAQERLWVLDQLEPGNSAYNVPAALRLGGRLDVEALRRTLDEVVRRHEVLRTTFAVVDGKPVQVVAPPAPTSLAVVDLGRLPEREREAEARRLAAVESQEPFDLTRGPLLRTSLLRLGEAEHVLLFTLHHIVSDGWSMSILVREVAALYAAFVEQKPSPLPELTIQYADFAVWQRGHLKGEMLEQHLSYWRKQLEGAPPVLELPTDRPRPAVQTFRGAKYQFTLSPELTKELKALARREGATMYMLLLAAFQTLLARYSGQDDIVVGTPIANRNRAETEELIGFFVNSLAMRANLSDNPTFTRLLGRVKETALGAYAHQDLPFEKLVEELQPERNTTRSPIFQVMFALQNAPPALLTLPGLTLGALGVENHTTHFDLGVSLSEGADDIAGLVEYNTDLFDHATVARMMRHYRRLLAGVVETPSRPVAELPLLDADELARLLDRWGTGRGPDDVPATVHQLFEAQAALTPHAVAVSLGEEQLTYEELNGRADELARRLRGLGVGPELRVGVLLERSPEIVVSLLGIFKAGGAYVPLDPSYPQERLAFMLDDAQVAVLLTHSQLVERLPQRVAARIIFLDREGQDGERHGRDDSAHQGDDAARRSCAAPDTLAYLIYTSGTTGRPKAVMVEHRQLVNTLVCARRHFGFTASDVMPVLASHAFDIWLFEALTPLLAGGTSLLVRREDVLDVSRLIAEMRRRGATLLHAVPSLMRQVVGQLRDEGEEAALPLRMVFVGGDAVGTDLLREMRGVFADSELRVLYGPTETAIICTAHAVKGGDSFRNHARQLIGRPLGGVRIRILDARRQVAPVGVAGEIYIGGRGVSRGYLNREELTAEKFVEIEGERYYRSGDVGRWVLGDASDGESGAETDAEIEFLGRADEQVKVRGFRVELGEVEAVIAAHEGVREAAVLARADGGGERRLVAYVAARSAEGEDASGESANRVNGEAGREWARLVEELRRHVRERLPEYMVPAQWVEIRELPVTAHGKVDRRRLPEAGVERPELLPRFVAPRTETEATLADIWAKVLRLERVGVNDNFFELGGDSILSIQTVARARQAGLHLTPKKLFQHQTVAELASAIAGGAQGVESEQGIVTGAVVLTPVQRRFLEEERRNPHHFNMAALFESSEVLNPAWMRKVVEKLLEHHDALRLRLVEDEGLRQFNAGHDEKPPFSYFDLSHLPEGERTKAIETEAARLQQSLSLAEGPLLRVALFHVGDGQPDRLLIIVHHFAFDGVSWRILLEDLQTAYAQLKRGEEVELPPKTTSFKRWAEALGEYANSEAVRSELPVWSDERRARVRPLPLDEPGGDNTEASARTVTVTLEAEETRALLQDVPAAYRTQIGDVLLTALAQAFARWTGGDALLFETEGHGRESIGDDVDVSRTVGWFTSVYPVLLALEETREPGAALKSVKEQLRRIPKGGIGYGLLRYASGDREASERLRALPQPEVSFSYHGQFDQLLEADDAALKPARESAGPSRDIEGRRAHLLAVNGLVAGDRLRFDWTYSENLHRRGTIERLAAEFLGALRSLVAHCLSEGAGGFTPSDFPLAKIGQRRLDKLAAAGRAVEDIYKLSPMQQGLLFHTLHNPASGLYVLQVSCTLGGGFDVEAFKTAWRRVIEQNTTLRTAIVWKGFDEPLQVVYRQAELPWRQEDWRSVPADEQRSRLAAALDEDLKQGFELSRAPLMRLVLRRLADDAFHLVWSFHHILLDGWSLALLLGQVFKAYAAASKGEEPVPSAARPYRDYIRWLESQDLTKAEEFWRRELKGFTEPTPLDAGARDDRRPPSVQDGYGKRELKLSAETTRRLQTLAQQQQLTLNTVVQGAWALLLGHYGGRDDIVLGAVVSGRPAELPGVETMLGIFINALPLRARTENNLSLVQWLKTLQERNVELRQYEYSPLVEVQRWSEVPKGLPLFESVFVFENYPLDESLPELGGTLGIGDAHFESRNNYPLTVHAHPRGAELVLQFIYQLRRFDSARMERMLGELASLLARMAAQPQASLGELKKTLSVNEKGPTAMEKATRAGVNFKKFKSIKPKAVSLGEASLVRTGEVRSGEPLPLVVEPNVGGVDAAAWARDNLAYVNEQLQRHGAILFRGFGLRTAERFEQFVETITPELFNENGEHPRRSISGSVYTPVSYPPDKQLLWHNENSFNHRWPMKIWFGCARPADSGGETPLVDSRRVFELLDPRIKRRFIEKKIMYVRNYEEGLGLNWQTVLRTSDKSEAEEICRRNLMEFEWKDGDRLRTRSVRPAVVRHPLTGEWVWFNQAQHWHVSCLDPAARAFVRSTFREEDYPRNCYYGDGTPIEDSVMEEILEVYRRLEVSFPWRQGDAVVLDNLLTAHGRNAYVGERSQFVAMGEMKSYDEVVTEASTSASMTSGGA